MTSTSTLLAQQLLDRAAYFDEFVSDSVTASLLRSAADALTPRTQEPARPVAVGELRAELTTARLALNDWYACRDNEELHRWRNAQERLISAAQAVAKADAETQLATLTAERDARIDASVCEDCGQRTVIVTDGQDGRSCAACDHVAAANEFDRAEQADAQLATLTAAVETVVTTFQCDEAQGFHSKDRQFAIDILSQALIPPPATESPA